MISRTYAEVLANVLVKDATESLSRSFDNCKLVSDYEKERSSILGEVLSKLWDRLMSECGAYEAGKPLLLFEKALACLQRKGVDWKHMTLQMTEATVSLSSMDYCLRKEGASFSSLPIVYTSFWNHLPMRWVALSGEEFADFMFEFDELVEPVTRMVDQRLHKYRVKSMQYEILCQTVGQLADQYLRPAGIRWELGTEFTERSVSVTFFDEEHTPLRKVIPLDSLAETIQTIPDRMKEQPKPKFPKIRYQRHQWVDDDDLNSVFP